MVDMRTAQMLNNASNKVHVLERDHIQASKPAPNPTKAPRAFGIIIAGSSPGIVHHSL
jgi:hypothetical protein